MKKMRKFMAFLIATIMMASNIAPAFASSVTVNSSKSEIINDKSPVIPAKLEENQTAEDLVKNPKQPAVYTLRTDYKVQRGDKYEVNYQPYIASVGEAATKEEKARVKQEITLPDIAGYDKSQLEDSYTIDYDTVKNAAYGKNEKGTPEIGLRYQENKDFRYKAKANQIKVKHVFQDLLDFNKYTNPDGTITNFDGDKGTLIEKGGSKPVEVTDKEVKGHERITTQNGNTGSTMEVTPLESEDNDRKGFVPERGSIIMQVPENAENFVLEYRYNRDHFDVTFDTDGGTPLPSRTLYYEQTVPTIDDNKIPTKIGGVFQGWMPSIDLESQDGLKYKAGEIIKDSSGNPIRNLDAKIKMPASNITFTAVWKDKEKADYVIQFWTEKADYDDKDDKLPLRDKYEYIGSRRVDNADTGSQPDLTDLSIKGITFPDLNDGRLEKAQNSKEEFERYYFLNEDLTKKQNASKKDPEVQKSVSSTGETVYNVYYDRRVYTLYFTAAYGEAFDIVGSFWPIITREGKVIGKEGSPYKVDVRFNQSLDKIWPKDEEVSNLPNSYGNEEGDVGLIGWTINNNAGEQAYRDTPPYRLSAEDFIDSQDVVGTGEFEGFGHSDQIPIKDGETKKRDKYEISIGSTSLDQAVVHHIDIIKEDFNGKEQIDYDMSYWKSDTNAVGYEFILPHLQGFTLKEETREAKWIFTKKFYKSNKTFDELNAERKAKTPFRSDADKIEYIPKFPWGTKLFDGKNAYNYANYARNSYKLKLNNDPKTVKNDSEYGEGNILDVPYEFSLKELNLDTSKKPEKPEWVADNWEFKGWALDPAGENLVKDGQEIKLHYDQVLFAKWDEPYYKWKVTFDPDGGRLKTINEEKLTEKRKTIQEGDIGQEEKNTYPKKGYLNDNPTTPDGKQIFTVVQRQRLVKPVPPVKKGYDFMGWEIIRYKKDDKGNYTDEVDNSYREAYKVPELYSFGNDVVSPIYLKAIWVPNQRVDVDVKHYFLDKDYNIDKNISPNPVQEKLEEKRVGYLVATTGDRQNDKYILATHEELDKHKDTSDVYKIYQEYNERVKGDNNFFQQIRVEPEKIINTETGKEEENPKAKENIFKFFYRPYRLREYKVNYIDEKYKGQKNEKDGAIVAQETVTNGNRHYDARNYRPIPGWVLTSDPQQQLFFDVDEKTNELEGINGTGKDEITFYYKDVRVIEVPEGGKTPEGYVRVTYKAEKGGSFTDKDGKEVTELHYDVIKGLKSDLLPNPTELKEGEEKEEGKYYITPDTGKIFTKWDNSKLLNKNTVINTNYVFTAYFEWSGLSASGLVRTEAFKDPKGTWTNDFAPTIEQLKKQLEWREKDEVKPLPAGTTIEFFDEAGNKLTTDDQVFELVNEKKAADKDQLVRTVNITAKATFKDGKEPQELNIPITVYKNVYEALTTGEKPLFLSEAEKGELKDITGNYVKVTVNPTGKPGEKDSKIYYVNPKAWVEIPEIKLTEEEKADLGFTNWTADQAKQNENEEENGVYEFRKRHKFTEDTVISPGFTDDVVPQEGKDKPKVPDSYVKVIVKTTDKATDETSFEKTFWVNPSKAVRIDVGSPTGKENQKVNIDGLGEKAVTYVFKGWEKVKVGDSEANLTEVTTNRNIILANNKYTDKVTVIEAAYKKSILPGKIEEPLKTTKLDTPQGKEITNDDLIKQITPQEGKEIESIEVISKPDGNTVGNEPAKVIVKYKDGSTQGTDKDPVIIPVEVHKNIIPEEIPGKKPEGALDNYVKVIFKAGTGGSLSGDTVYYVSPEVEVDMTESAKAITKNPETGYFVNGEKWTNKDNKDLKGTFTDTETEFVFNFDKSKDIVEKIDENTKKPDGYVVVTFKTEDEKKGTLENGTKEKIYYVNPKAGIKLVELADGQTVGEKELAVPKTSPAANYVFDKWYEEIDQDTPITSERIHVAKFVQGQVTLTYEAGEGATGNAPNPVTVNYGEIVGLAGPGELTKENATFAGWKLDDDETIYQPGGQVKLEKARTAIAQWKPITHKVTFNTMGGSDVASQTVEHGKTATNPEAPKLDSQVFMGWKEQGKEKEDSYFDFTTPITEDKTLIAIWKDAVQVIDENATVEDQFIKVTFKQGDHGKLQLDDVEQTDLVTYKVAKGLSYNDAVETGLVVPDIVPDKYYKAKDQNYGWDKTLDLVLEGGETEKIFTAQYEPEADVIPIDPETSDEDIEKEKPDDMVVVEFVVPQGKAYMDATSKFYVAKNKEVTINPPTVYNSSNDYEFTEWQNYSLRDGLLVESFYVDTIIPSNGIEIPDIKIVFPANGDNSVEIDTITSGATGYIKIKSNGTEEIIGSKSVTQTRRVGRRRVTTTVNYFEPSRPVQTGDEISYWAIKDGIKSITKYYTVE